MSRTRTWEDIVGLGGFFGLSSVALVIAWFTRHTPGVQTMYLPMALFGVGLACLLILLPRATRRTRKQTKALIAELGLACPSCGQSLVSPRGEIVLSRGKCDCGTQVVSPEPPEWHASLPNLDEVSHRASRYNFAVLGLLMVFGAGVIVPLLLLEERVVEQPSEKLLLGAGVAALMTALYWSWTRLHRWCGAACPFCHEALVGGKGDDPAGITEETRSCPYCGTTVAR